MEAPIIIKPVPAQTINELAGFRPFRIADFIAAPDGSAIRFEAGLKGGASLPKGMICTSDGILTGIPARGTAGIYEVVVTAQNEAGSIDVPFGLTINPGISTPDTYITDIKAAVWSALQQQLPIPELDELYNRPINILDVYYLLERWGILTAWDAFNLDAPAKKILLNLEGTSEHYNVYDRGCCIVACPKDLFSHERTLADGIQTAKAVAREVYKRNWTVELTGFDKLSRAAWVEIQRMGDVHGKQLEVINFDPTTSDVKLYAAQSDAILSPGRDN